MTLFYHAFIEPVLALSLVSWFGNLPLKERNSLNQIIKWSGRLIGETQLSLESLYTKQLQRLASSISNNVSHPLASEFQQPPSGRRFIVPRSRTSRYRNSFVPAAVFKQVLMHFEVYPVTCCCYLSIYFYLLKMFLKPIYCLLYHHFVVSYLPLILLSEHRKYPGLSRAVC